MTNQEKKKYLSQAYIIERHIETLTNENHKIQAEKMFIMAKERPHTKQEYADALGLSLAETSSMAQKYNINLKKEKAVIN